MVEQTHSRECHRNIVFIAALNNDIVTNGTAGFRDVRNAALLCTFDVIGEREERVGTERNTGNGSKVIRRLFSGERFGAAGEVFLPYAVCANVFFVLIDITVDNVIAVRSAKGRKERKV